MTALQTWTEPRPVKLSATDFMRLADAGAFRDYAKTELIEGVIVAINAQYSTHARVQTLILVRLAEAVKATMPGFEAWVEAAIAIAPGTQLQPDIVVTSYRGKRAALPSATIALVVEIADTTAAFDLGKKARLYAAAGIAEYWVVDLEGRAVRQLWAPRPDGYAERRSVALGERVEAATITGLIVDTQSL